MNEKTRRFLQWGILATALAFLAIGTGRGEPQMIWMKAVNVCLECIGIG